jgi:tRNA1(Val) A37 N6-methylase TrmN6
MKKIIRTSDTVRLSWLTALLADRQIDAVVFDAHTSVLEGLANAIPRRLMVVDEDYDAAMGLLAQANELDGRDTTITAASDDQPDHLMNGRVILHQPRGGYRSAIDPVFLAAAVPDFQKARVLDVGCGVGAAALCYTVRASTAEITGLELQPQLANLAEQNIAANGVSARMQVFAGDLLEPPPELQLESFDEVMANPPYFRADQADPSPDVTKAVSTIEGSADLACWVRFCIGMARPSGGITFIHRADRLDELLALLHNHTGAIVVFPLWPSAGRPAKRVIVHARRGARTPMRLAAGMVLHSDVNVFSNEAESILRGGTALTL